ncbi:hypothetical protein L7H23_00215 [Sphingopyxis sp. BSN-002]|uniref:hypothetical protein n=1 Tax=Sphingopyxis sp. BSN-002 TaxID=2911495 RepID=UPI001EDB976C|nr:hypothetical protein [Sphingopyxis sp. BSN-002]UKK84573.1 hypothetical protein L7H23_00215 [Sphingopyxis sp. BSN-002]
MEIPSQPLPWLVAAVVTAIIAIFFWLSGSAVVVDETGGVESAVVTDGHGREQALHKLWNGRFYAMPNVEGSIEVGCSNGVRKRSGYVTRHWHTKIRVDGDTPCARLVDVG